MDANEARDYDEDTSPSWRWIPFGLASCFVLVIGTIADFFGPMDLGDVFPSDAVAYLDCARAFGRGDFHAALNPLWSPGYPALLATVRPAFAVGADGVWWAAHALNLLIFMASWFAFCWFVRELMGRHLNIAITTCTFLTAQVCVDQVSRIGPDKLGALCLYLTCALVLRLAREPGVWDGVLLGFALGAGFLAKAPLLPVGCVAMVAIWCQLWRSRQRASLLLIPAGIFGLMVVSYGAALSHATGWRTLGESGSLNYAWHVNRLEKWVHWQGGALAASDAWDSPRLAGFAHWSEESPDFGRPDHPTQVVGSGPTMFFFQGGRHATYDPYYDPPFWYRGYWHVFNWRYQAIALAKNGWHLLHAVAVQPFFWAMGLLAAWGLHKRDQYVRLRNLWPIVAVSLAGICIYLPVHLEDRYIGASLAVLAMTMVAGSSSARREHRVVLGLICTVFFAGLTMNQHESWANALRGKSHRDNAKWKLGKALRGAGLGYGAQVGVVSSGPNYDCDWAYLGQVEIVAEIASGKDESAFVNLSETQRKLVVARFSAGDATALLTRDEEVGRLPGWVQLGDLPLWIYRRR